MADTTPNEVELYDDDIEQDNKLVSMGLRGSNKVVTHKSGGPFAGERFGRGVVDYATGYKQTTIAPVQPYKADVNEEGR